MRKQLVLLLTASSLTLVPVGWVSAQAQSGGEAAQTRQAQTMGPPTAPPHAFGHRHGFGGPPFGRLALGTTVTLTFYDGDPASGAERTQTLTFTYGSDSEAAFAERFAAAREGAAYLSVEVGEQTRTLELAADGDTSASLDRGGFGRGFGYGYGRLPLRGLTDGSSVTATFYDGDPEGGGQRLQTLTFAYGESSAAGFAADFAEAAEGAAYVVVTTSPRSYTVPLTAPAFGLEGFGGRGRGERGGFGPGGFGPGGFGPGGPR